MNIGVFYLLRLEPEHDPSRFKVRFANNLNERLRHLRCAAPYTQVMNTWPCRRLWEKTAIECVTDGCERLHTEVSRSLSLETIEEKCAEFFALMPKLAEDQSKLTWVYLRASWPIAATTHHKSRPARIDLAGL